MKKAITFYYDHHSGELVKTKIHKNFQRVDSLMEADVLQDCLGEVQYLYDEAVGTYFHNDLEESVTKMGTYNIKERIHAISNEKKGETNEKS